MEIRAWLLEKSNKNPNCKYILSGASAEGEGELKIIHEIHREENDDDIFVIFSPDSDMYMSSMLLS
jgi:5'-3' exonuclease